MKLLVNIWRNDNIFLFEKPLEISNVKMVSNIIELFIRNLKEMIMNDGSLEDDIAK
jgi:hypothetical protein